MEREQPINRRDLGQTLLSWKQLGLTAQTILTFHPDVNGAKEIWTETRAKKIAGAKKVVEKKAVKRGEKPDEEKKRLEEEKKRRETEQREEEAKHSALPYLLPESTLRQFASADSASSSAAPLDQRAFLEAVEKVRRAEAERVLAAAAEMARERAAGDAKDDVPQFHGL